MSSIVSEVRAGPPEARESRVRSAARWANRPSVAIVAVGMIAGILRLLNLGYPSDYVFDELYYAKSACIYLGYSNERCNVDSDDEVYWRNERNDTGAWVHPPLGKWMIAGGEAVFGTGSFGWRIAPALFGTGTVMLVALIGYLLFRSPLWAFTAGLLAATENLLFVHSRVAMLDGLVAFWIVLAFAFALLDRRWMDRRTPAAPVEVASTPPAERSEDAASEQQAAGTAAAVATDDALEPSAPAEEHPAPRSIRVPSPLFRPWRVATGLALGAAIATKWSGVTALVGILILTVWWEVSRRRTAGLPTGRAIWRTVVFEGFPIVVFLLLVPAVVYVTSYAGWFAHFGWDAGNWVRLQESIAGYHRTLEWTNDKGEPVHPYLSQAWKWLLLWRPVLYYARYAPEGEDWRRVIYANGNPAIFWGSLIAMPYLAYAWWRRRDWRATFIVIAIAALYLPWLIISRPQYLFYAVPIVPFLVLACVYLIRDLSEQRVSGSRSRPYLPVTIGFVVIAVGLFVWFWPTLTAGPLSGSDWSLRNWFPSWT
jgi:dolichyl-phosphate-mannose--protein O-mannosyl transferase